MTETPNVEQASARMKSYTGAAVLTFFLYWLFYVPGLIVNVMYYIEGTRMQRIAKKGLPGVGCLGVMLWLNVAMIALGLVGGCAFMFYGLLISGGQ